MMVNLAELLPSLAGPPRALAAGLTPPATLTRQREGAAHLEAICPACTAYRPAICIMYTAEGWMCDGCISDRRRRGVFVEWPGVVLPALAEAVAVVALAHPSGALP